MRRTSWIRCATCLSMLYLKSIFSTSFSDVQSAGLRLSKKNSARGGQAPKLLVNIVVLILLNGTQPLVRRAAAGNLLLSSTILFTGNTFSRLCEMASVINMAFPCESEYLKWQNQHIIPVINQQWQHEKAAVVSDLQEQQSVMLLVGGRCDSPG